jgi:hypothetical protein
LFKVLSYKYGLINGDVVVGFDTDWTWWKDIYDGLINNVESEESTLKKPVMV